MHDAGRAEAPRRERGASMTALATVALALLAVLALHRQAGLTLRNDAFVDEATYIVSGQMLQSAAMQGVPAPPIATYLSGAPHLYPRFAATLFATGGLEGVRAFSLVCLLVAIVAVYAAAQQLFRSHVAGIAAAALFAAQAPALFLSRFATYDAPCVALLAVALALALDRRARTGDVTALCAGLLIGLATMVKYASLMYVPAIVLVCALVVHDRARWRRGTLAAIGATAAIGVLALFGTPQQLWAGFVTTTFARSVTSGGEAGALVSFALTLGGAVAAIAVPSIAIADRSVRWAVVALYAFALLAPLNHVRLHEFVSLHKHMAFALVLFATLAGGTIGALGRWLLRRWERNEIVIAAAVAAAAIAIMARAIVSPGLRESQRLFRYWPDNTERAYRSLAPVASANGNDARFLSEEPDLGALYLGASAPPARWVHPYYFDYAGAAVRAPDNVTPFRAAIRDGYFTAVVLRFGPQRAWALAIEEELLRSQPRYRLAAKLPFALADGSGAYQIWVRTAVTGSERVR